MKDELKLGHKLCRRFETALYTEGQYATETMLEVLAAEFMVRIALETRVVHAFYSRMLLKEFRHCKSVVAAALGSKR